LGRLHFWPVFVLAATAAAATARAQTGPVAYVQATITAPDAATGSLGYMDASGRSRVARVSGPAAASLPNLRPGDEVILTVEGPSDRSVVTSVKVSRVVPAPPPPQPVVGPYAWTQTVSSRPSWPNPYSRINPGLPLRPGRRPATASGTLTVVPAASNGMPGAPRPVAAPAMLSSGSGAPAIAPPAPAAPTPDETSGVEGLRARGARDFDTAVSRLAGDARAVDAAYARYQASCPTGNAGSDASRGWFGVLEGAAVGDGSAVCASRLAEVMRLGAPIKSGMLAAHEAARRAWVLPGTMRDIRRRHAMDWSGWDR
jgi:hypothetical protein